MSRTIKAIKRHMIRGRQFRQSGPPIGGLVPWRARTSPRNSKLVAEWRRGLETLTGSAQRKLRLVFAPSQSTKLATVNR